MTISTLSIVAGLMVTATGAWAQTGAATSMPATPTPAATAAPDTSMSAAPLTTATTPPATMAPVPDAPAAATKSKHHQVKIRRLPDNTVSTPAKPPK